MNIIDQIIIPDKISKDNYEEYFGRKNFNNKILMTEINNFLKIMKDNKNFNLDNFINRLPTLITGTFNDKYFLSSKLNGYFQFHNRVMIHENADQTIYFHEFLHVASTPVLNSRSIKMSGFYYKNLFNEYGIGIMEGYTDYLTKKYCNCSNKNSAYDFLENIAKYTSLLVGEDKMEKMYSNADLVGLINELNKYADNVDVTKFIISLDNAYKRINSKKNNYINYIDSHEDLNFATSFLIDSFKNKNKNQNLLTRTLNNNEFTSSVYKDSYNIMDKKLVKSLPTLSKGDLEKIGRKITNISKKPKFIDDMFFYNK